MNIIQVIIAFALFTISFVSASQLSVSGLTSSTVLVVGNSFTFTVNAADQSTTAGYNAVFTESISGKTFIIYNLVTASAVTTTINNLVGSISFQAVALNTNLYTSSVAFSFTLNYPTLTFSSPSSGSQITYGNAVTLQVNSNSNVYVDYVATFTCPTGVFQVSGLTVGTVYRIVPAGIYGQVVVTVTADSSKPATTAMKINKASANIPPALVPGRMIYYPSVYSTMKEDGNVEIVSVEYLNSPPM